jgi:hypothetical protein
MNLNKYFDKNSNNLKLKRNNEVNNLFGESITLQKNVIRSSNLNEMSTLTKGNGCFD